jgi:hypothetical protein
MASQQDIHAAGAENRPPVLEKGGYLPWTSRMLRYIKTKDYSTTTHKVKDKEHGRPTHVEHHSNDHPLGGDC